MDFLLIAPYGIETKQTNRNRFINELLIAPYGIETLYCSLYTRLKDFLLIAPYGIETQSDL